MKKLLLLLSLLVFISCQVDEIGDVVSDANILSVRIEHDSFTRTFIDDDNNVRWSEGDQIKAFLKSSLGLRYQILPVYVGKTSAEFEKISEDNGHLNTGMEWEYNVAYYPYEENVECEKSGSDFLLSVYLPEVQEYVTGSFGNDALPMVAISEDNDLTFRNICGGIKFRFKGTHEIASVTVEGMNSECLSGPAKVTAYTDGTAPSIIMEPDASTKVTLKCPEGVRLSEDHNTDFIIVLPPVVFADGFVVTVRDVKGRICVVESDEENIISRSSLLVMPEIALNDFSESDEGYGEVIYESMPSDVGHGINYNPDGSVTFVLYDLDINRERHDYCYIVGDWNNWDKCTEGNMKRDESAGCWWITLDRFDPDVEYRFQYILGCGSSDTDNKSDIYVSDPYTEIVYDQWNDMFLDGVPEFPEKASGLVSAFQINKPSYTWKVTDFEVKDKNNLIIYEMLFRDFTETQDIAGAIANFDYIKNLGVNAVELMPIQEFDGNKSWGYNPNHWFALDKYYGTREEYKQFIDLCHENGIAVIVDVVYNHATGSHPWAKMWWDGDATADNNPWFNRAATHPYNVYHDMNHENAMVKEHVKQSLEYLLTEYKVDGFRFDLTKGFTQTKTGPDIGKWGIYDASRVAILKGYADYIWSVDDNAVVIFEHFANWDEEEVLAQHGIQLWRNMNDSYRTLVFGGNDSLSGSYEQNGPYGGWVSYMESHDEERLCANLIPLPESVTWGVIGLGDDWTNDRIMSEDGDFFSLKNVSVSSEDRFKIRKAGTWEDKYNHGASTSNHTLEVGLGYEMITGGASRDMYVPSSGVYDIYFCPDIHTVWLMNQGDRPDFSLSHDEEEDLSVAMRRSAAAAAFFLTVPGPKMIWQFGEIGYDYTILYNGRTGEKPVVTDKYMADKHRKALYDTYAKLIKFRNDNPEFFSGQSGVFSWNATSDVKTINGNAGDKKFHVVGNFKKSSTTVTVPSGTTWKDYFNNGATVSGSITLKEGEFKLLTNF